MPKLLPKWSSAKNGVEMGVLRGFVSGTPWRFQKQTLWKGGEMMQNGGWAIISPNLGMPYRPNRRNAVLAGFLTYGYFFWPLCLLPRVDRIGNWKKKVGIRPPPQVFMGTRMPQGWKEGTGQEWAEPSRSMDCNAVFTLTASANARPPSSPIQFSAKRWEISLDPWGKSHFPPLKPPGDPRGLPTEWKILAALQPHIEDVLLYYFVSKNLI